MHVDKTLLLDVASFQSNLLESSSIIKHNNILVDTLYVDNLFVCILEKFDLFLRRGS